MFALNEGWQWQSANFANALHGVVYLASTNNAERMRRKPLGDFAWQLFDPQLYLASLEGRACTKVCARLATFPWFGVPSVPEFDSSEDSQQKWQQDLQNHMRSNWPGAAPTDGEIAVAARSAIEFQADRGCTHLLAATPLITEREDEAATAAKWIDAALEAASDLDVGQPVIATVAVSEGALNDGAFIEGGFLDTIVDQVSSRDGLGGVYIVVAQTQKRHPLSASTPVTKAYAHLTSAFARYGYQFVFVNFADAFGVACAGLGASGFGTGPTQSLRRLSLTSFLDEGGGLPLPHLYSHRAIAEFLPERELETIARLNLLRRVTDITVFSRDLFQALNRKQGAVDPVRLADELLQSPAAPGRADRRSIRRPCCPGRTATPGRSAGRWSVVPPSAATRRTAPGTIPDAASRPARCANKNVPVCIVKSSPRFPVEKIIEMQPRKLKSIQPKSRRNPFPVFTFYRLFNC
jgi:hypothetical protein